MSSIDETLVSFLKLIREDSFARNRNGSGTHTRAELISIFQGNFENKSDFSQIMDLLFYNDLMDAESKKNGQFEGFFVTDLGIEFLRRPEKFEIENGELERKAKHQIDATAWTGKTLVLTDQKVIVEIRRLSSDLHELIHSTPFQSNSDSQDLKSLADALVNVCAMAEPDIGIIERIISHPKFNLSSKFVGAVAIIRGALGL